MAAKSTTTPSSSRATKPDTTTSNNGNTTAGIRPSPSLPRKSSSTATTNTPPSATTKTPTTKTPTTTTKTNNKKKIGADASGAAKEKRPPKKEDGDESSSDDDSDSDDSESEDDEEEEIVVVEEETDEEKLRKKQEAEERNALLDDFILPKPKIPDDLDPVQAFVAKAIQDQDAAVGNQVVPAYRALVDSFRVKRDLDLLRKICLAIRCNTTLLHLLLQKETHARLIHFMVRLDPFAGATTSKDAVDDEDEEVRIHLAEAHLYLLLSLVSAKSVYVVPVLTAMWNRLLTQVETAPPTTTSEECSTAPTTQQMNGKTKRLHAAIATLLELCPKGKSELFLIISSNVPFRTRPDYILAGYFAHALHVTLYLPEIEHKIVELLIDKCLEMDVEIKISDTGEATIEKDTEDDDDDGIDQNNDGGVFAFDDEETAHKKSNTSSSSSSPIKLPPSRKSMLPEKVDDDEKVDEMANKLDTLLYLLFQFIESRPSACDVYPILLRVFTTSILITYKSKFAQFVLFYTLGLERRQKQQQQQTTLNDGSPAAMDHDDEVNGGGGGEDNDDDDDPLYRDFCAQLVGMVVDPLLATPTRQSAVCYLASLVSRASYVHAETVCETVSALLRWTEAYMHALDQASWSALYAADARDQSNLHSLFYTVCQAAFYVMCFRGKDAIAYYRELLAGQERLGEDELNLYSVSPERWIALCGHLLKPLNYCLESVRTEFLLLSTTYELLDDGTLDLIHNAEAEKQLRAAQQQKRRKRVVAIRTPATLERERRSGGVGGLGRGKNPLGSFFPFDPYLLRDSHVFIEPFYNHWTGSNSALPMGEADNDGASSIALSMETPEVRNEEFGNDDEDEDDDSDKSDADTDDEDADGIAESMEVAHSAISHLTHQSSSPAETKTRVELQAAWTQTLKRSRAPSIENGSW